MEKQSSLKSSANRLRDLHRSSSSFKFNLVASVSFWVSHLSSVSTSPPAVCDYLPPPSCAAPAFNCLLCTLEHTVGIFLVFFFVKVLVFIWKILQGPLGIFFFLWTAVNSQSLYPGRRWVNWIKRLSRSTEKVTIRIAATLRFTQRTQRATQHNRSVARSHWKHPQAQHGFPTFTTYQLETLKHICLKQPFLTSGLQVRTQLSPYARNAVVQCNEVFVYYTEIFSAFVLENIRNLKIFLQRFSDSGPKLRFSCWNVDRQPVHLANQHLAVLRFRQLPEGRQCHFSDYDNFYFNCVDVTASCFAAL